MNYLMRSGLIPGTTANEHLDACVADFIRRQRRYSSAQRIRSDFPRFVSKYGLLSLFPKLVISHRKLYGVPWPKFPEPMRSQFEQLFEMGLPFHSRKRRKLRQVREITIRNARDFLSQLLGYARNVKGIDPLTVEELLSEELVPDFVEWGLDRGLSSAGFKPRLGTLNASIKEYDSAPFVAKNFAWLDGFIRGLEGESRELIEERKAQKWVEYDCLDAIADKIEADMKRKKCGPKRTALMARNALIFRFLPIIPFRQLNFRGCTLGRPQESGRAGRSGVKREGGNLFKGRISPLSRIAKPTWVVEALKGNPRETFWQVHFHKGEMKGKRPFHIILPRELVAPLEQFHAQYRPALIDTPDSGPLFPAEHGRPWVNTASRPS